MEASLQIYRPFGCRRLFLEGTRWKIKPSHVSVYSRGCPGSKYPCHILATSDSSRKRQRKTSKPKSASPKGYSRSSLSKSSGSTDTNQKDQVDETSTKFDGTYSSESKDLRADTVLQTSEEHFPVHHKEIHDLKDDVTGEEDALVSPETRGIDYSFARHVLQEGPDSNTEADLPESAAASDASENDISREAVIGVQKLATLWSESQIEDRDKELHYIKSEKDELLKSSSPNDISVRKEEIEKLALQKSLSGIKVFIYPDVAKAGHDIEIFLNRSASTLKEQPTIQMMGAFNEWRWKSFTQSLRRTELQGDWWSCSVHVPKETYQLDFVFFDGDTIYENNDSKDFFVSVTSGMDRSSFEDYLLEEKRHELERLAAEQAEKEREAAEKRQLEEKRLASEEDKAQARVQAEARRAKFNEAIHRTFKSDDNLWYIEPLRFKGGDTVRLYYNRSHRPLATAREVWVHGGYNNWQDGLSMKTRLVPGNETNGDWWSADIMVPDRALVLDWVFADGPPETAKVYDNNNSHDFHAPVPERIPEDLYWAEEEHHIYMKLQHVRKLREEAKRLKAEKTAWMKWEMKEKTRKRFLQSQKHVVYTDPLDVRAGEFVTVFYNPTNTVLSGSGEIWFRCSFNRWTHRNGPVQPQRMVPVESSPHMKATVKVPLDTFSMDFVFSNSLDGGTYDNKDGIDYHLPVIGGIAREPPMHIVHIAVEMAPIAKVGGLGDVVTSLSRAVQDLGHNVEIILPKYDCLDLSKVNDMQFVREYGWGGTQIKVWLGKVAGLSVYFLEPQNGMFWVKCIYGCKNDGERFGFFCHAALEFLLQSGSHPDILHCHDWSSAPVSWLYKENYQHYGLSSARVVFTIHNLEFGANLIGKAMAFADKATTVSPTYSKEVSGNPCIAPHLYKFHGIINGIDPDIWDPYNDHFIPVPYTSDNAIEGKRAAKEALQQRLGLRRSDCPLVGIISRLTAQKGINLIKHAIWRTLDRGGQVVLLGSAPDPKIQNDFAILAHEVRNSHSDWGRLVLTYDEPLSHLIYAGADFILVPSLFEPCGLTQLVAMRYGAVPVVRRTGGLNDTVFDVDHDRERAERQGVEPNGFSFDVADSAGVDYALNRAISSWYDAREFFNSMCKGVMEQDWSWNRPALDYMELYYAARKD